MNRIKSLAPMLLLAFALAKAAAPVKAPPAPSPRFAALVAETRPRVREVSARELQERLAASGRPVFLLDVREDSEWAAGRLQGALHLPRGILERDIEKTIPDAGAEIVLYCGAGSRSILAADSLGRMGYSNVASLKDGYRAWVEAGYPVVK